MKAVRFAAVALCGLFVASLPFALAARNLAGVFFSAARMASALESSLVDTGALKLSVVEAFAQEGGAAQEGFSLREGLAFVTPAQKLELGELLFPDDWMRVQIHSNVDRFYSWLEQGGAPPAVEVDLGSLKGGWLSGDVNQMVATIMKSWPACTPEMVGQFLGATVSGNLENLLICRPGEPLEGLLASFVATGLKVALNAAPDRLLVANLGEHTPIDELEQTREQWNRVKSFALWGWTVPCGLLLLVGLLKVRDGTSFRLWMGWPLLLAGLVAFAPIGAVVVFGPTAWRAVLSAAGEAEEVASLLGGVFGDLMRQVGRMQAWQACGMTLAGGVLLMLEGASRRRARRRAPGVAKGKPAGMFG
jgi:hypothetical protein